MLTIDFSRCGFLFSSICWVYSPFLIEGRWMHEILVLIDSAISLTSNKKKINNNPAYSSCSVSGMILFLQLIHDDCTKNPKDKTSFLLNFVTFR